jgi:transposase-like protein
MPWAEVSIMSSRREFARLASQPGANMAKLCRAASISRKTGYKWLWRYRKEGDPGLQDHSRRPKRSPKRTKEKIEAAVLEIRAKRHWGARKIEQRLSTLGYREVPAVSTIQGILQRHQQVLPEESIKHRAFQRFERATPNELWQMDFKGHFATDSARCHPLTVLDDHSRFSLALRLWQ